MKQSAYERARDQAIADEVGASWVRSPLMCAAAGCPLPWSVSGERGKACSAHYWAPPHEWPRITQRILDAIADRDRYAAAGRAASVPVTSEMRKAAVAALHAYVDDRHGDPRAWARELQRRHEAGERLRPDKVQAYRGVLRLDV